jgi:FkbM family methyltransferase
MDPSLIVSFAQNQEDVVLARVLRDVCAGFYVDVGANDPVTDSVTKHFYDKGWCGINVEPGTVFAKVAQARPRDRNYHVAASERRGVATFHEFPNASGLSSLHDRNPEGIAAQYLEGKRTYSVPTLPLREIFSEVDPPTIDFLSVDAESHEREVLLGNDWSRWRPRVVVIEATLLGRFEPGHHLWEDILTGARYHFAYRDGVNRFYVREEDAALRERFHAPNISDRFVPRATRELEQAYVALEAMTLRLGEENARHSAELARIKRGLGQRTLNIGLAVARVLHGLGRVPSLLRPGRARNEAA